MTSLEGVWRTGVRAAELETLMLLSSRGCPLITVANGPLMARRSWPALGQVAIRPSVFQAGHNPSRHKIYVRLVPSPVAVVSVAVSSAQVVRWQADPDRRATRPEDRKRRGRATHYEGVLVRCSQVQSPCQLEVHEVPLVAVVGC